MNNEIAPQSFKLHSFQPNSLEAKLLHFMEEHLQISTSEKDLKFKIQYGGDYLDGVWDLNNQELTVLYAADTSVSGPTFDFVDIAYKKISKKNGLPVFKTKINNHYKETVTMRKLNNACENIIHVPKQHLNISIN